MKKTEQPSYLKRLIQEVISETIVGNNDIKAVKGKAIKEVRGSETKIEIVLDDDSTLVINSNNPKEPIHYHLERGMLKTNGSNLTSHGEKPQHVNT